MIHLQMENLSKEEFVHILRRHSTGFSRGSSKYRGVTLHKCGRWEARMGQFLGKKWEAINYFSLPWGMYSYTKILNCKMRLYYNNLKLNNFPLFVLQTEMSYRGKWLRIRNRYIMAALQVYLSWLVQEWRRSCKVLMIRNYSLTINFLFLTFQLSNTSLPFNVLRIGLMTRRLLKVMEEKQSQILTRVHMKRNWSLKPVVEVFLDFFFPTFFMIFFFYASITF